MKPNETEREKRKEKSVRNGKCDTIKIRRPDSTFNCLAVLINNVFLIIISVQIINFPLFVFSHSVERTPHVGKEREGGRASNGTEGAAQRGGDLHR